MEGVNILLKSILMMLVAMALVQNSVAVRPHALRKARYLNSWALEVHDGSDATADVLAQKHGLVNRGQVRCPTFIELRACG